MFCAQNLTNLFGEKKAAELKETQAYFMFT